MARGFGATLGVGTTDLITSAHSGDPTQRSMFILSYRNGVGGAGFGRMFDQTYLALAYAGTTIYSFQRNFSSVVGQWTFTEPGTGAWARVGVKYDQSSTSNDPTVFLNGSKLTVGSGLTEAQTPSGTPVSTAGIALGIGNRAVDSARNWDGMLAESALWDVLLDDDEFFALAKGYSPQMIRPASLIEYVPMVRPNISYKLAAPTVTGTAVQPHPRVIYPAN